MHSVKRNKTKTWLRVIGRAGWALLGWRWGGGGMDLQGEGMHQSLISCALESSPTFILRVLRPRGDPRACHCRSLHCCKERKPVFSFMVHVYFWCVAGIVMFLMAGPGGLSRMMVHLRETVLMMHWPWLQAPFVLNKHTHTHRHDVTHSWHAVRATLENSLHSIPLKSAREAKMSKVFSSETCCYQTEGALQIRRRNKTIGHNLLLSSILWHEESSLHQEVIPPATEQNNSSNQ